MVSRFFLSHFNFMNGIQSNVKPFGGQRSVYMIFYYEYNHHMVCNFLQVVENRTVNFTKLVQSTLQVKLTQKKTKLFIHTISLGTSWPQWDNIHPLGPRPFRTGEALHTHPPSGRMGAFDAPC